MATVFAGFTVSLDGFIANPEDSTHNLFDWFNSGDTEVVLPNGRMVVRLSPASAMVMRDVWQSVGAIVAGRRMFDLAHGWGGRHPLNVPVSVVSHSMPELPEGWPRDDAPFTFVIDAADGTDGVEKAIEQAKMVAGDKMVILAGANIAQQALKAGLLDEIEIDLVPVLLGRGIRCFEYLGVEPIKLERTVAVMAPEVTHLRFRVIREREKREREGQRMTKSSIAAERALEIWQHMQDELVRVVGQLTDEQMSMRIAPNVRTLGEQAEHIVRGRALWVHKVVDDPSLEPMMNWDEPGDPTRSVAEVVAGLQHTWQIWRAYIEPSTRADPALVSDQEEDGLRTIWGLLDHDLCHAGELALMLGVLGLETPEF